MADLAPVFAELRALMLAAAPGIPVTRDETGHLELRGPGQDAKSGEPVWFGMIRTGARAVAYHLPGLYTRPALAADLPAALQQRRQGKTCFNFARTDADALAALADLTRRYAQEAP